MRCRQMSPGPDAARCQLSDATRCQMPPDTSCQMPPPPRPGGGLGEVSRAPVLMSSALISGDVLPPSVRRAGRQFWGPPACDDERRAPAVKSGVTLLSMSPVQRFCSALSFHPATSRHSPLRPLGRRPRRLQTDASGHGVRRRRRRRQ